MIKTDLSRKKILLTGGAGFLGNYVTRQLLDRGALKKNILIPRSKNCDLRLYEECLKSTKGKDLVIHLAAKVGGIAYNKSHPATIFDHNSLMNLNLLRASHKNNVKKFVMIGSVCEYPKITPIPFNEENLWNGYPEESNGAYGLSKKLTLVQGQAYRQEYGFNYVHLLMANLYGPGDNFDPASSHVIPALIKKFVEAKEKKLPQVEAWGTGIASREFLYVNDAAEAIVKAAMSYDKSEPVNIGASREITIKDLSELISSLVGYKGRTVWDKTKPDGQLRRAVDSTRAFKEFGFKAKTDFEVGLKKTIGWYVNQT